MQLLGKEISSAQVNSLGTKMERGVASLGVDMLSETLARLAPDDTSVMRLLFWDLDGEGGGGLRGCGSLYPSTLVNRVQNTTYQEVGSVKLLPPRSIRERVGGPAHRRRGLRASSNCCPRQPLCLYATIVQNCPSTQHQ